MGLMEIEQMLKEKGSQESVPIGLGRSLLEYLLEFAKNPRIHYKYLNELEKLKVRLSAMDDSSFLFIEQAHDMNSRLLEIVEENRYDKIKVTEIADTQECLDMEYFAHPLTNVSVELMLRICGHLLTVIDEPVAA